MDWEEDQNLLKARQHSLTKSVAADSEVVVGLATVADSEGAGAGSEAEDSATAADSEEEAVDIGADGMTDTGKLDDELDVWFALVTL